MRERCLISSLGTDWICRCEKCEAQKNCRWPGDPGERRKAVQSETDDSTSMKNRKDYFLTESKRRNFGALVRRSRDDSERIEASEADLRRARVVWNYPPGKAVRPKHPNEAYARELAHQGRVYAPEWWLDSMESREVSAEQFRLWRTQAVFMNQTHAAAFFRVPIPTITAWEKGRETIPYAVAFMMRWAWNCDEVRLSRPGFHDWAIYYDSRTKEPKLYSKTFAVEFSAANLTYYAQAMGRLSSVEFERDKLKEKVEALQVENTKLREMFKSQAVTGELREMQSRIGSLLERIHTADVIPLNPVEQKIAA